MKRLRVFLLPLDGLLVHRRVTPSIKFAGTHLYTWVERGTVGVKCLAQEHNTMSPARARTRTARSGVERTNHEATAPPTWRRYFWSIYYLECREIHTNYREKWLWTGLPIPRRGRHFFCKVGICFSCRREQCTSFSNSKHLKMTNKHLGPKSKQDTAIWKCQNLQRNVWPYGRCPTQRLDAIHFFVNFEFFKSLYLSQT